MMPPGVGVRPHIKIIFSWRNHYNSIQVTTFKHCIKVQRITCLYQICVSWIHPFESTFFNMVFGSPQNLILHLLIYQFLYSWRQFFRNFEREITTVIRMIIFQNFAIHFKAVIWTPPLVNDRLFFLHLTVRVMVQIKQMVLAVKNERNR